jgi:uncharacterized protein YecA (UPF0149 family)
MKSLFMLYAAIAASLPMPDGKRVAVRTEPKIGRNELCHCNSGNKYKKCCIIEPKEEKQ